MDHATQLYIARAAVGIAILLLVWLCAYRLDQFAVNPPQHVTQLRGRHVLPFAGLFLTIACLFTFARALLPA